MAQVFERNGGNSNCNKTRKLLLSVIDSVKREMIGRDLLINNLKGSVSQKVSL